MQNHSTASSLLFPKVGENGERQSGEEEMTIMFQEPETFTTVSIKIQFA
jgi:hypothetical protein